jgi:SAM-dependent methyltransferase
VTVGDAENLPFLDNAFDRVYSWGVLHHTPDTARAVREATRVLRPGGRLCAMLYARHSWVSYGLWARYALLRGRPRTSLADVLAHHMESEGTKGFTKAELRGLFAGLEHLRVEHVGTPYDRRVGGPLVRLTGGCLGWFVVIRGEAPTVDESISPDMWPIETDLADRKGDDAAPGSGRASSATRGS